MSVAEDFAVWLSTPRTDLLQVDALEFLHPSLPDPIRIVNRVDRDVALGLETGASANHSAVAFRVDVNESGTTTDTEVVVTIDGAGGAIAAAVDTIEAIDLSQPLLLVWRVYLLPDGIDAPEILPPMQLRVETMDVSIQSVVIRASGARLPNKEAGYRYNLRDFPGMRGFVG